MKVYLLWKARTRVWANGAYTIVEHDPANKKQSQFLGKKGAIFCYFTPAEANMAKSIVYQSKDYVIVEVDLIERPA